MNLLSVSNLSKAFGARQLFSKISFGIQYGEKVALVARNGSGKTTLFRILRGLEIPDEGEVVYRKDLSIGFLEQDFSFDESLSIQNLIDSADNRFVKCIRAYDSALLENETSHSAQAAARLEEALQAMNRMEAWDYEKNILEILSKLEIRDTTQRISTLSGGQKKRLALALTLINRPEFLVMDEPTNHLDIDMIEWLENYLQSSSISLLLVTHDRYFLDEVCDRIIEIDQQELFEYKGNFDYYLEKKAEREQIWNAEVDKARNLYRKEVVWVRKMPKARGTKSKSRVDAFYEIEKKARQKRVEKKTELVTKMERMGSKVVELHRITKSFPNRVILSEAFTYAFIPGEKIGLVGKNGTGKTTLLNIIQGKEPVNSGKVQLGETIVFGYYSQSGMQIDPDKRILELVRDIAEHIPLADGSSLSASQLLTRFNFPPSVQYAYAHTLSGGEKRRLYLLTVLMKNPNFLILDEPTNDLDIVTLQSLEEFLEEFKGCVLIVSHDRYFIDRLVDHTFVLEGNGAIRDFPGNYTEYRLWKSNQKATSEDTVITKDKPPEPAAETPGVKESASKKLSYKTQRELQELELEIPHLELKKKELETSLSSGISDYQEIQKISEEISKIISRLDEKSMRWLEIQELLSSSS
ncbi:MAG TPA: ABC-F family ATP-binding cassette domain-containing protein [Bacteroidia bacterium]|nr:ABC-F family ATP-binding cassette domain-containing protein [Bacteroidia bacterium]